MRNPILAIAATGVALGLNPAMASPAKSLFIEVDKGVVRLEFVEMAAKFDYEVKQFPDCLAQIERKEKGNTLRLSHTAESCPRGSIFTIKVNRALSTNVTLNGGVFEIASTRELFQNYASIDAVSNGGVVSSEVSGFDQIGGYAPARAYYESRSPENKPSLRLFLNGGVINFYR